MISRWPFYASVAVLGCECIALFLGGSSEWGESTNPARYRIDSGEAAEQARFAIELYAIGALNLLASIAFLRRRSGWGWWLALGMQVGGFAFAQIEGRLIDPADGMGWFFVSGLPLLTLILLIAFRKAQARPNPPAKRGLRRLIAVVLLIAVVFAIRQFAPAPDGFAAFRPVSASELAGRPEAHMYFPGSIVLGHRKQDETGASTGDYAFVFTIAATGAAMSDVIEWYRSQMGARGWSPACLGETCNPRTAPEWSRGDRETFVLYFLDPTSTDYKSTSSPTEYAIYYQLVGSWGVWELYCLVFRRPHYTGPPTGQHFLC